MIRRSVEFGSKKIQYSLEYTDRRTLGITVTPEMKVLVKAPPDTDIQRIDRIVKKRAPWILRQLSFFLVFFPKQPPKQYVSGESFLYLGRQYRLKVRRGKVERVKLSGRYFYVVSQNPVGTKSLMQEWYWDHAEWKFNEIVAEWLPRFKRLGVEPSELVLRSMPKRWGSCTSKGKIILNPELIKASRNCIEYVIVHEMCHLIHHDHNRKFLGLQKKLLPDWEKVKSRLELLMA